MMADVKWIKIMVDIFDDEKIQIIEALPSADTIIVIWFKLLCLAGKTNSNGVLIMNDRIAYTDEMLAAIFRRKVTDVRMALETFKQYGMVEIIEDTYVIPNWGKHQSLDYHERKKEYDREYHRQQRLEQKKIIDGVNEEEKCRTTNVRTSNDLSLSYSYSFNINSNIDNFRYLIDKGYKDITSYIDDNPVLKESIESWMSYKDGRSPKKNNHYTEQGMKGLLTEIVKWHKQYGDNAVSETVLHTISNQWQGIVWDWMEKKFPKVQQKQSAKAEPSFANRPERWRTCPESTWQKLKPFASDDGSFDWGSFDSSVLNDYDREWMRQNNM